MSTHLVDLILTRRRNIDHFFFLDVPELEAVSMGSARFNGSRYLEIEPEEQLVNPTVDDYTYIGPELRYGPHFLESGRFKVYGKKKEETVKKALKDSWAALPGPAKLKYKDYAVVNVAPSIIPAYLPAARIYSYNISGVSLDPSVRGEIERPAPDDPEDALKKKKKGCNKPENQNKPHCTFKTKPRYASPGSPSRSNTALSVLGYTQFYIPNLDTKKSKVPPSWEIEYTTFKAHALLPESLRSIDNVSYDQPPPVPYHLLPEYDPEIIGTMTPEEIALLDLTDDLELADDVDSTANKKTQFLRAIKRITPWKLKDLTIKSYVKFARKLVTEKKSWKKFQHLMFVSSGSNTE